MGFGGQVQYQNFRFYTGARANFIKKASPTKWPWGMEFHVQYLPEISLKKIQSFAVISYQVDFFKSACFTSSCTRKLNTVHAYTAGYGMEIQLGKGISLSNSIQLGRYTERFYNGVLQERYTTSGLNALVKLGMMYILTGKN